MLALLWLLAGSARLDVGSWYEAGPHHFAIVAAVDGLAVGAALVVSGVTAIVLRFSASYVHLESGHLRFFAQILLAEASALVVVLAGSLDLMFFGWELLGLCSFLLIGFFHERAAPARRALRAFFTYRTCDLGILTAAVILAHSGRGTAIGFEARPAPADLTNLVGLLLLLGASGKSALAPFTGWLARATEGPTPSTALFYGALSIHAGPYLLLRAWPMLEDAALARAVIVGVGLVTAVLSTMASRVRTDAKGAAVLAGSGQVGLVVAEIGLGWWHLAAFHMLGNIGLRLWQLLRAPSAIQLDRMRSGLARGKLRPPRIVPAPLYMWAAQSFHLDAFVERWLVAPLMAVARGVDRLERRMERIAGVAK
jgi:NADH-quinone oxidoreductase subunit L